MHQQSLLYGMGGMVWYGTIRYGMVPPPAHRPRRGKGLDVIVHTNNVRLLFRNHIRVTALSFSYANVPGLRLALQKSTSYCILATPLSLSCAYVPGLRFACNLNDYHRHAVAFDVTEQYHYQPYH